MIRSVGFSKITAYATLALFVLLPSMMMLLCAWNSFWKWKKKPRQRGWRDERIIILKASFSESEFEIPKITQSMESLAPTQSIDTLDITQSPSHRSQRSKRSSRRQKSNPGDEMKDNHTQGSSMSSVLEPQAPRKPEAKDGVRAPSYVSSSMSSDVASVDKKKNIVIV
ncbi:hypothetical protein QR680_014721 [Steinernema hermaphroditum]|uniref:Uncharacterized protein n=1 Tax=Steinernema hermaphroditum TaxID=289476 RepID=A0AA39M4J8_9BILA|nr:hypothetical protein QR680_014721 [Steinernema hermaphroditum]